jgi:hypothetical protein
MTPQEREQIDNYQQLDRLLVLATQQLQEQFKKSWLQTQQTAWSDSDGMKLYNLVKIDVKDKYLVSAIQTVRQLV